MKRIILEFFLSWIMAKIAKSRSVDTHETFFSAADRLEGKLSGAQLDEISSALADVSYSLVDRK